MLWIFLGMLGMLAGLVVTIMISVVVGVILLLAGGALMVLGYVTMMHGRGDDPEQGVYNGLGGQGKQQSETIKAEIPEAGEQSPAIWEKMQK